MGVSESTLVQADIRAAASLSIDQSRIDRAVQRDVATALAFVAALWLMLIFSIVIAWTIIPSSGMRIVAACAAAALLVFNTASMLALVRNYRRDRDFIYRRDIMHLDAKRAAREPSVVDAAAGVHAGA